MKKIFLLLIVLSSFVFSAIDEYKTDVYFGNGILTKEQTASRNAGILEDAMIAKDGMDYYNKNIAKVTYAYNRTDGAVIDLLESLLQKVDGTGLVSIHKYAEVAALLAGLMTQKAHDADLKLQEEHYKDSIKNGHKVLVVAHSQGNLFAYEAYKKLPSWMKDYWEAVSVASPMNSDIKDNTPRINWDNDLVASLALVDEGYIDNPVRKVGWRV